MPRASYQYGTSPRKYEPEYRPRTTSKKTTSNKVNTKKVPKKSDARKRIEEQKAKIRREIMYNNFPFFRR